ncbi:MAG: hypothetical protein HY814_03700 [Candidatus Riflebacteria bacterium]|nr:hypothetical protein [Candidatus Riflebacteria bacterium]
MTSEELVAAVNASEPYRTLDGRQSNLLLRTCAALASTPGGMPLDPLLRRLRGDFSRTYLDETLEPMLQRFGLFRLRPEMTWTLADSDTMLRPFAEMPVCVIDVEATGGRPPLHRIIELGALRVEPDGSRRQLESLVNPGRPLPPFIAHMTGLRQAQLDEAPPMGRLLPALGGLIQDAILIAHDVSGDMELLNYELFRERGEFLANPVVCTVAITRTLRPEIERLGLESVAADLGIEFRQRHRALDDAVATAAVWNLLKTDLTASGVRTLLDLSFYQGSIGRPDFVGNRLSVEALEALPAKPGLYRLRGGRGEVLLRDASADLRQTLREHFYPRHRLPPELKRVLRDARDLEVEPKQSLDEARSALRAEHSGKPEGARRKPRRRGRRRR